MNARIEKLPLLHPLEVAEGPHWDIRTQSLYFVDVMVGTVFKYNSIEKEMTSVKLPCINTSIIIPIEGQDNKFVVTSNNCEVQELTWNGKSNSSAELKLLQKFEENTPNRINDGKCDPQGRLWGGTVAPLDEEMNLSAIDVTGSLYSFSIHEGLKRHFGKIAIANGLCWSSDTKLFYYVDSLTKKIDVFDFDCTENEISNRRTIFDFKVNGQEGLPDGMTIDAEDKIWVACFESAKVLRIDPITQKVIYELDFPSYQVTSVAFGGQHLDELYVTSANFDKLLTDNLRSKYPDYGKVFKVTGLGVKGTPMRNFKL